jgi:signal transduction histidine kinase
MTSVVVTVALVWFGWRSVGQQSAIDRQLARERLDTAADAVVSGIRGKVAEAGERLSGWVSSSSPPTAAVEGAVVVASGEAGIHVVPPGALPYVPFLPPSRTHGETFAIAEAIEFAGNRLSDAAGMYRRLSRHSDPARRAEALLRLGRVTRTSGDFGASLAAYRDLARFDDLPVAGLPAGLAALEGQSLTFAASGDRAGERRIALEVARSIDAGRWLLARGAAEFYRDMFPGERRMDRWLLAEALAGVWETELKGHPAASGLRIVDSGGRPVLAMWRSSGLRSAMLAAFAEPFLIRNIPTPFACQLSDAAGRRIAGAVSAPSQSVTRLAGDSQNPWMLRVWPAVAAPGDGGHSGQRFLLAMLAVVILFLWSTVYFMARAIRREARVARLQSDFVAAVSHEFRSPLTTVRQLAEMLEIDSVPSEERRRKYYSVLASEARRLQRLIETVLNFGRIEAGVQQYRFEDVDVAALVDRAVREACGSETTARSRIHMAGPSPPVRVLGDADALTVALRNILENGLKYSPVTEPIEVAWASRDGCVFISVTDHGPGIPKDEQEAIFQKFVRGRSALQASIRGTGVGLAMVHHILAAHGGKVQVDSEPGQGASFTILLSEAK